MKIKFVETLWAGIQKHSPEILLGAGIAGTITSTILACKATLKLSEIAEERADTMQKIDETYNASQNGSEISYTEEDMKRDVKIVKVQTVAKTIKAYMPSVVIGVLSVGSILTGHKIMKKRNLMLAAAYTTVNQGFKKYRKNVVDKYGKEVDQEMRYGIKAKEITKTEVDAKGKEKEVKETVYEVDDVTKYSPTAKIFDETCPAWSKDPNMNLLFLRQQQNFCNDKLKSQGYLFLDEVYKLLGFPVTALSRKVGWIYDPDKNDVGDNYVDFGIYDVSNESKRRFVNGHERSIILDFNIDGVINEKFEKYELENNF